MIVMGDAYPPDMVATLIDMYKKGELLMEKICKVFPVEKFKDAIAAMHDGSVRDISPSCCLIMITLG